MNADKRRLIATASEK